MLNSHPQTLLVTPQQIRLAPATQLREHPNCCVINTIPGYGIADYLEDVQAPVVAGDDAAPEMVLGYSATGGTFSYEQAPENLRYWLGEYARQIEYMANNGLTADQLAPAATFDTEVAPMITTQWDQDAPYNDQCPVLKGKRTYTGCVATAMAQLMNYHEWPKQGTGSHSYTWNNQVLSADFGSTAYDWDNMADTYDGSNSNAENEAVATLMYHCGDNKPRLSHLRRMGRNHKGRD